MTPSIVCGVNDSTTPVVAAVRLAERLGVRLVLVQIAPDSVYPAGYPAVGAGPLVAVSDPPAPDPHSASDETVHDKLRARTEHRLARLAEEHGARNSTVRCELGAAVPDELRRVASQENAELLVVGSRGRGVMHAGLLGSVSHALAADAPCPVVIVPEPRNTA